MVVFLQLPMQSVPITTKVVSSNHGEVYLILYYVIKFVSDLRQVCGFLLVLRFPPPRYNWNISESCIKHHKPLYCKNMCSPYFCWLLNISRHWCIEINIISCDRSTILKALIMCKQLSIEILQVNDFYIG